MVRPFYDHPNEENNHVTVNREHHGALEHVEGSQFGHPSAICFSVLSAQVQGFLKVKLLLDDFYIDPVGFSEAYEGLGCTGPHKIYVT